MNIPASIGRVVSRKMASLYELQTHFGAEDLYNLMEILAVDAFNEHAMSEQGS